MVRLTRAHDRAGFHRGEPSLDDYLRQRAAQDERRRAATCWVLGDPEHPAEVLGYYTLSAFAVDLALLSEDLKSRLARYPMVSAILVGRLAVSQDRQGHGLGQFLLADAIRRAAGVADTVGAAIVVVDALHDRAAEFYRRFGFLSLPANPHRLVYPLADVGRTLPNR